MSATLFILGLWVSVLAYIPLQVAAVVFVRRELRLAVLAPLLIIGPTGVITVVSFAQESNLWPCLMFLIAPLADVYLIGFLIGGREPSAECRLKRGLCPECEYPIGTSPVCTECGAAVQTTVARASRP
jgi:hypothetical protein